MELPTPDSYCSVVNKVVPKVIQGKNDKLVAIVGPMNDQLTTLDPFLLIDHFWCRQPAGFSDHPHRGFEAITYLLEGGMQHEDCFGSVGSLSSGFVQVMTCGKGIVHAEQPQLVQGQDKKGFSQGIQLWLNLPQKQRLCKPKYQERSKDTRQKVQIKEGVELEVVIGSYGEAKSTIKTQVSMGWYDIKSKKEESFQLDIPTQFTTILVYLLEGEVHINKTPLQLHQLLILNQPNSTPSQATGGKVQVQVKDRPTRFLILVGEPTQEPIQVEGFFVASTRKEIDQAKRDFSNKVKGFEKAKGWKSKISTKTR